MMSKEIIEQVLHEIDEYFDKSNNTLRDSNNLIQSIYESLSGEIKPYDWQPDWSKAPKNANAWLKSSADKYYWYDGDCCIGDAPSFDYKGDWRDSRCKRP